LRKELFEMPYAWMKPEVALEYKGVMIYHIYKNDNYDEGRRTFLFGYSEDCDDNGTDSFDVRDLAKMIGMPSPESWEEIKAVLIAAIDKGVLTQEGIKV
jgi:hypothetical protein